RVIAYSTVQELSIMMVAIGSNAVLAAVYFFFAQTFYKALLFFSAGNIMEATERDYLNDASGLTSNPLIYYTTLAGVLSLAGFIPFAGFFANEGISNAVSSNMNVYLIMSLISVLTSFYIFRWMFYPSRKPKADIADRYSTQPATMVLPMALLAALALLASAFFFMISDFISYGNYLPFLSGLSLQINIMDSAIFLVLITIGAGLSYMAYVAENIAGGPLLIRIRDMLYTNPLVNLFYRAVYGFTYEVAEAASILDTGISDVFDDVGLLTVYSGNAIKRLSVGSINLYALMVIVGILAMFAAFYLTVIV
ncbi:MAG: hypothetical protein KGH64_05410, partial [Candidatus Micrarchaeota archaeon]|nr:hypothetical protein [Candidatus Micrarchaeota archaeon]